MKNFWKFAEALGVLSFIGAVFLAFLGFLAVLAASFGSMRPFSYLEFMRVPYWAVIMPALGILAFLPLALREAFTHQPATEEKRATETVDWRQIMNRWRSLFSLRPV
jgi:hypothetical protein